MRKFCPLKRRRQLRHGLKLLEIRGARNDKTLLIFAGVHGDEYAGSQAVVRLFERLDPRRIKGRILMVPNCNPSACKAAAQCSTVDGKNLSGVFSGNPSGTLTERIACILSKLIRQSDFLIDLHSGGRDLDIAPLSGYLRCGGQMEALQHKACIRFGLPIVFGQCPPPKETKVGPSLLPAWKLGVPAIYCEIAGANSCCEEHVVAYENGMLAVAAMLGIIPKHTASKMPRPKRIIRENDLKKSCLNTRTASQHEGIWIYRKRVLQRVQSGEIIGELRSLDGECLDTVHAPSPGQIILLRHSALVKKGDWLYCLA